MSFGGHVNDMINRVKQNAALKNARRKKFKGGNDYSKTKNIKTAYNFSEFSQFCCREIIFCCQLLCLIGVEIRKKL